MTPLGYGTPACCLSRMQAAVPVILRPGASACAPEGCQNSLGITCRVLERAALVDGITVPDLADEWLGSSKLWIWRYGAPRRHAFGKRVAAAWRGRPLAGEQVTLLLRAVYGPERH